MGKNDEEDWSTNPGKRKKDNSGNVRGQSEYPGVNRWQIIWMK